MKGALKISCGDSEIVDLQVLFRYVILVKNHSKTLQPKNTFKVKYIGTNKIKLGFVLSCPALMIFFFWRKI